MHELLEACWAYQCVYGNRIAVSPVREWYWLLLNVTHCIWWSMRNYQKRILDFVFSILTIGGTAVAQWLRCCATIRKVAGSIPTGVSGFFYWHKILLIALWPWGRSQPLTEMSTRSISWGWRRPVRKADNLPPSCAVVTKSGNHNFLEPSGPVQTCNGTALPLLYP